MQNVNCQQIAPARYLNFHCNGAAAIVCFGPIYSPYGKFRPASSLLKIRINLLTNPAGSVGVSSLFNVKGESRYGGLGLCDQWL